MQPGEISTPEVQQSQTKPLVDIITPVVQRQQASQQQEQLNTDAVQLKCSQCEEKEKRHHADEETQLTGDDLDEQVQLKANGDNRVKSIQQLAAQGFSGSATTIPHLNQIQQSFGVELSHVQAYIGSDAAAACQQMGADAYASGNQIAFKQAPSVELAAHEAAHVVQQASGKVQLSGGVGKVGDKYEQQADDVAARVAAGQSAKDLLREYGNNSAQENIVTQASEMVQQQVVAPPPVPVVPPPTGVPPNLVPFIEVLPWITPLVIPGGLLNPLPTANDQIDPKTGRPRFPQQQPQIPPAIPLPKPRRYPNQTCEDEVLDKLQVEKDKICNSIPGESCSPSKVSPKKLEKRPCSKIRERNRAIRDCLAIRQRIQDQCFGGKPDQAHQDVMDQLNNGLNACLALEKINCAPGHPMANL